jgi:hypothetical protein
MTHQNHLSTYFTPLGERIERAPMARLASTEANGAKARQSSGLVFRKMGLALSLSGVAWLEAATGTEPASIRRVHARARPSA